MIGRLENENKMFFKLDKKVLEYPEYVQNWYYYLKANDKTAKSINDMLNKVIKFLNYLKDNNIKDIEELNSNHVIKYFNDIKYKKGKSGNVIKTSDSYRQTVWSILNNFFDYLEINDIIEHNYLKYYHINRPKNNDLARINEHRQRITASDLNDIIECIQDNITNNDSAYDNLKYRDLAIVLVFINTGIRNSALTEINIDDIDFKHYTLEVKDKGNKYQVYPLSEKTIAAIKQWMSVRNYETNILFTNRYQQRISTKGISDIIKKYTEEVFVEGFSPHKLRAAFCSILYEQTRDIEFVRRAVGHSNVTTTQRYVVTDKKERERASNIIENLINFG